MGNDAATDAGSKRQHVRASSADFTSMFEEQFSAAPSSAIPWSAAGVGSQGDPWAAAQVAIAPNTPSPGQQQQTLSAQPSSSHPNGAAQSMWNRFPNASGSTSDAPTSPYPQSAITPRASFSASPAFTDNEPKSAHPSTGVTKSPGSKGRKRHAPAISSAWNQGGTPNGKIRGRPPSNRNVQDGPYGTFPVNPNITKENAASSTINTPVSAQQQISLSPPTTALSTPPTNLNSTLQPNPNSISRQPQQQANHNDPTNPLRKPSKLQLQVPHQPGNPIRLATPPRVLVNGESQFSSIPASAHHERRSSADFFSQLDEVSEADEMGTVVDEAGDETGDGESGAGGVDWKRRALTLMRRLQEKEEELKRVKRAVLDAVM